MANASPVTARKLDWTLANPWLWLGLGVVLTFAAWLWARTGPSASEYRVIVLALGLLATGAGIYLRWQDRETLYLQPWAPGLAWGARTLMGVLFSALGLGILGYFAITCVYADDPGYYPGATFFVALSIAPISLAAARQCLIHRSGNVQLDAREEIGLSLVVGAVVCLLGWFALFTRGLDWDTMRMFLRVLLVVCLLGAALTLATVFARRLAISVLVTLHFAAITNATLAVDPAPWILKQAWMRLSSPYLEFMYLVNAYHFYAPEPGPYNYLWFRVIFKTPEGQEHGLWYKVPGLDEEGNIEHPIALEYQRYLAMTESIRDDGPLPAMGAWYDNSRGMWLGDPRLAIRLNLLPRPPNVPIPIGVQLPKGLRIPLDPYVPGWAQQVRIPSEQCKKLLSSYARYVAHRFATHPEHPDWTFHRVKVYRVVHVIPEIAWHLYRISPTEPETYRPYYSGLFDKDGVQRDDQDPYLNWLLPSIRKIPNDPTSDVEDYARLHAGDPYWFRSGTDREWREHPTRRPLAQ